MGELSRTLPSSELGSRLLRFSVMSFSPSMHSRNSFYSTLAARALMTDQPEPTVRLLALRSAEYAAEAHVPWGETPRTTPPAFAEGDARPDVIRSAVASGDQASSERWLAALLEAGADWRAAYLETARDFSGEEGWGLATARAAVRAIRYFPEAARFATLRTALKEWVQDPAGSRAPRLEHALEKYVKEDGATEAFADVVFADADGGREDVGTRVEDLDRLIDYRWSSDFGAIPQLLSIAQRNGVPAELAGGVIAASRHNLESGLSYSEWSFA